MESTCSPASQDLETNKLQETSPPTCPFCGGTLLHLRGQARCLRCYYSACEGCEGESE